MKEVMKDGSSAERRIFKTLVNEMYKQIMLSRSQKSRSDKQFKNIYQREAERKLRIRARMVCLKLVPNLILEELSRGSRLKKIDKII